jgi:hypothetical protein
LRVEEGVAEGVVTHVLGCVCGESSKST